MSDLPASTEFIDRTTQARSSGARFESSGDREDINSAINHQEAALNLCSRNDVDHAQALHTLAFWLGERYERWGDVRDLETALSTSRTSLDMLPDAHPGRLVSSNNIGNFLFSRYQREGRAEDLAEAISLQRTVLDLMPDDHQDRAMSLHNTANYLMTRCKHEGRTEDVEEAIALNRAALNLRPEGQPDRYLSLHSTACCLYIRYGHKGKMEDLEEAISLNRTALSLCPVGQPRRSMLLSNTAGCLLTRYRWQGKMEDLEEAIALNRAALDMRPDGHPERPASLNNTAECLFSRYIREGRREDLGEAIILHRTALDLLSDGNPNRSLSLRCTANCLMARYAHEGRMEDLEEAIALHTEALVLRPDDHPDRPVSVSDFANCLLMRYKRTGRNEDLEKAIALHRTSLGSFPEGHPDRSKSLNNAANCLIARYDQEGRMEDLEEAIALYRIALDLRPDGHPERFASLNNIAGCLSTRYQHEGRMEDLEDAITFLCAALDLLPEGHSKRPLSLNNLANCFSARYDREGKIEDLGRAISFHRAALRMRPDGDPGRSMSLTNIANCLLMRHDCEGRMEDLEEAIALHREAFNLRPDGHPDRSSSLNSLADCLVTQYRCGGKIEDLEEAISLVHAALALRPDGHPGRSACLHNTAECLFARFEQEENPEDLEETIRRLRCAAVHAFSSFSSRVRAARRWAAIARSHNHESLAEAYKTAISVLQRALTTRCGPSAQHKLLSDNIGYQAIAMDAASSSIDGGNLVQAIEFLEQGRALLWSQMRGLRTPLDQLARIDNSLAERFEDCSRRLTALTSSPESQTAAAGSQRSSSQAFDTPWEAGSMDRLLVQMRKLYEEQEAIIREIRRIDGFEDFFRAAPFGVLKQAASEGPVVVLNHSRHRCDAIIILPRENEPCVCVSFDKGFHADAANLHKEVLQVRRDFKVDSREYDEILRRVMKFLWDRAVSKVVTKFKELGVAEGSRIWWCPTSVLTAFPFHAAGPYEGPDGKAKYLLDDFISSYTPTLTSLINSRSGTSSGIERMLFAADTKLPSAKKERAEIRRIRPIDVQLRDAHATPDAVLRELQRTPWVHFVCHGKLEEEPFNSSLGLPGGRLTLLDIARANLPNAEFAFLSACHTAGQGSKYAVDEALHLSAAMQFCGFKSVVGTMWQLLDRDGPFLSGNFYAYLKYNTQEGELGFKKAAEAVRAAALKLRGKVNEEVHDDGANATTERWVNLVHIGA